MKLRWLIQVSGITRGLVETGFNAYHIFSYFHRFGTCIFHVRFMHLRSHDIPWRNNAKQMSQYNCRMSEIHTISYKWYDNISSLQFEWKPLKQNLKDVYGTKPKQIRSFRIWNLCCSTCWLPNLREHIFISWLPCLLSLIFIRETMRNVRITINQVQKCDSGQFHPWIHIF